MKLFKRLTTLVMILALLAVPMTSLAAGIQSFSIGNFAIDTLGTKMNIGATISVSTASKGGKNLVTLSILGGETGSDEVGTVYITSDGETLKAALKGLSSAFVVTNEELKQLTQAYTAQANMPEQFDTAALTQMIESYGKLIESQKDGTNEKEKEIGNKFLDYLDDRFEVVGEESYELFGKTFNGQRVKFTVNLDDFDAYMDICAEADENGKKFLDSYFKFLSSIMTANGMEPVDSLSELYKSANMEFDCDVDMLYNSEADAVKADMKINVTQEGKSFAMPMQMQILNDGNEQRVCVIMDTVIEEVPFYIDVDSTKTDDTFTYNIVMNAGPEDEKVDFKLDVLTETKGEKETCTFALSAAMNGQSLMTGEIVYDGTAAKTDLGKAHEGKLSVNADAIGYGTFSFAADLKYVNEPRAEVDFAAIDALPVIAVSEINEEKMKEITSEAEVIGIKALGVLMQTPGVAELVSMAMAAVQSQADSTSEYGYEDYSADSEQLEDFEDWQQIEGLDGEVAA